MSFDDVLLTFIVIGFFLSLGYMRAEIRAHRDRMADRRRRFAQNQSLSSGGGIAH